MQGYQGYCYDGHGEPSSPWAAWLAIACACLLPGMAALAGDAAAPPDWGYPADGSHVLHLSARAVWSRCVEGMRWDGRHCVGEPLRPDHAGALAWARRRAGTEGLAGRLPQVKELQHLLDVDAKAAGSTAARSCPSRPPGGAGPPRHRSTPARSTNTHTAT